MRSSRKKTTEATPTPAVASKPKDPKVEAKNTADVAAKAKAEADAAAAKAAKAAQTAAEAKAVVDAQAAKTKAEAEKKAQLKSEVEKLRSEVDEIAKNQKGDEKKLVGTGPSIQLMIDNHCRILRLGEMKRDRPVKLEDMESRGLEEEKDRLEKVIERHKRWEEIFLISEKKEESEITEESLVQSESPANFTAQNHFKKEDDPLKLRSAVDNYLEKWRTIVKDMPDIEEKIEIQEKLETLEHEWKKQDIQTKTGIQKIELFLSKFDQDMQKHNKLFRLIKKAKEHEKLMKDGKECLEKWKKIANANTINREEKNMIQAEINELEKWIERKNEVGINDGIRRFARKTIAAIEKKSENTEPSPAAKKHIEKSLTPKINKILAEIKAETAKGKKIPLYKIHKLNVLLATRDYLENKINTDTLEDTLRRNGEWNAASLKVFGETKRLVGSACRMKGDDLSELIKPLDAKKDNKQEHQRTLSQR